VGWILFRLDSLDNVLYNTNQDDSLHTLTYKAFLNYLWEVVDENHLIRDYLDLKKELNSYEVIKLDLDSGEWEVVNLSHEMGSGTSFFELAEFNRELKEKKEQHKQDKNKTKLQKMKDFIGSFRSGGNFSWKNE
jgi:hypothetical protein